MSVYAAGELRAAVIEKPNLVLGLPTGSTPLGLYKNLVNMYQEGKIDFSGVQTFNLDEYYPIKRSDPQSYYYFMNENLFSHINIEKENIHIPDGSAADTEKEAESYEKMIEAAGGIDIQVLGSGVNGHIGFNEPAGRLSVNTHRVELTENTIEVNSRFFEDISQVPRHALTMGVGTIFRARRILILINGENKAEILKEMFGGTITTDVPATLLALHPDTTVITDEATAAAAGLSK
jgi:glucosamine-6-phosphate deaminase